jgi:M3 family oligoendopeptidase
MGIRHLRDAPKVPSRPWLEARYAELDAELERAEPGAVDAFQRLAERDNDIRVVIQSGFGRLHWACAQDMRDRKAEEAETAFMADVYSTYRREHARFLGRFLGAAPREALAERLGKRLLESWRITAESFDERNIELGRRVAELALACDRKSSRLTTLHAETPGKTSFWSKLTSLLGSRRSPSAEIARLQGELDEMFTELVTLLHRIAKNVGLEDGVASAYRGYGRTDFGPEEVARYRETVLAHVSPALLTLLPKTSGTKKKGDKTRQPRDLDLIAWSKAAFRALDGRLHAHFEGLAARGRIDAARREGKRPGGFCLHMPDEDEVRIFCHPRGTSVDLAMLLHESGHAFHRLENNDRAFEELAHPPADATEVFSLSIELLAAPRFEKILGPPFARALTKAIVWRLAGQIVNSALTDAFEHEVHRESTLTADARASLWRGLRDRYMPRPAGAPGPVDDGRSWHRNYLVFRQPFHSLRYSLAAVAALQLHRIARNDQREALERWFRMAALGGTVSYLELLRAGGLESPFDPETLPSLVGFIREELAR